MENDENSPIICWICRRTYKKSNSDYKKIILRDEYGVVPEHIKDQLKSNNELVPLAESGAFNEFYLESKLTKVEDQRYIPIKGQEFTARVCVCDVCAGILSMIVSFHDDKVSREELQGMVWVVKKDDNNKGSE